MRRGRGILSSSSSKRSGARGRKMEGVALQMKVKKLQKIIPGGEGLDSDELFVRTADYILLLKLKISVLQILSKLHTP
ncbi:transcription factor PAR1 [Salvia hispanica]|uniref:transcription factor PAR1 n=1 Tax=Salvia hispanica TaxID=49212 RepID=UPI002009CF14|nr:transcription factor PAR1 [Salvia hispanica]